MAISYGILRGAVINDLPYKKSGDHYQIELKADQLYRVAVDVYSELAGAQLQYSSEGKTTLDTDRMVMYYKDENFIHPLTTELLTVAEGFTPKAKLATTLCLDYLRTTPALFSLSSMTVVAPASGNRPGDNLNSDISPWVQKAMNNANAEVFAFGSYWDDNNSNSVKDNYTYFNPDPTVGMHDIHMNQGDTGSEASNNGSYQDGALLFYFKTENQWIAMFFRFQNQSIKL